MKYFKYYSPQNHKKMKNLAVASLEAMSLTPEEDVSFGLLQLPVAWESQDVLSMCEDLSSPLDCRTEKTPAPVRGRW